MPVCFATWSGRVIAGFPRATATTMGRSSVYGWRGSVVLPSKVACLTSVRVVLKPCLVGCGLQGERPGDSSSEDAQRSHCAVDLAVRSRRLGATRTPRTVERCQFLAAAGRGDAIAIQRPGDGCQRRSSPMCPAVTQHPRAALDSPGMKIEVSRRTWRGGTWCTVGTMRTPSVEAALRPLGVLPDDWLIVKLPGVTDAWSFFTAERGDHGLAVKPVGATSLTDGRIRSRPAL
jgi:hypothetical protein